MGAPDVGRLDEMWRVIRTGRIVRRWQWRKFRQVLREEARDKAVDLLWSAKSQLGRMFKRSTS